jgi:ubiquinone/menaquinone biosynthesis C-methylase UbiE
MLKTTITKIDKARWAKAQTFELSYAQNNVNHGDDYNHWWRKQFDNYKVLNKLTLPSVLEVGCGPHTNIRLILQLINFSRLLLEDPLIHSYLCMKKQKQIANINIFSLPVEIVHLQKKFNASLLSEPLEELSCEDESIDLCVCINVLDHVRDSDTCLHQIERVTKKGGIIIIGQDLSNQEDQILCPESWNDTGHPIKMDKSYLDDRLSYLSPLLFKVLPREEGRNPRCHYGTYIMIGRK